MRHLAPLMASLAVASVGVGTTASASVTPPSASVTPPPRASLTTFACQRAFDPPHRSVSVTAVMRPVAGTRSMSLKFDLLKQQTGTTRALTGAGDLGIWLSPKDATLGRRPGDVWKLNKTVSDLDAPAGYRFRVTFRWLGTHDTVLATAVRQSAGCTQRELRPDLLVRSAGVSAIPNRPRKRLYTAVIANAGASGAGPFQVLFTPGDGTPARTRTVTGLGPHSSRRLSFIGPLCDPGSPPTEVADSTDEVNDSNRGNNALTVTCPS